MAASIVDLASKVDSGEPLSSEDIAALGTTRDIIALGMLATTVRRKLHAAEVTYVRVVDLKLDGGDATTGRADPKVGTTKDSATKDGTTNHAMPTPVVVPAFRAASLTSSAGEIRIFQTPDTLGAAIAVVERARDLAGATPLSAFCLFELGKLREGLPVVLPALKRAGLDRVAQAPIDRLADPERAIEALTDAGMELARLTVNETPQRDWTAVCRDIAALQTKLQAIRSFAPLPRVIDTAQPTTGYEDVKRVALARLLTANVDTIQVDWTLYGPKLAQVALTFGADDIDSVSAEDDSPHGHRRSPVEEIRRGIHAAGFEPVERDGRFQRRG